MTTETRNCQNCKNQFTIEPEDFNFYEKMHVPPPTWCPECRLMRRLAFLNHRTLYKRKCSLCNKGIIALYDEKVPFPVYCPDCYWSDKWDASNYGRDYDFSRPFFEQYKELSWSMPHLSLMALHATLFNSEYNNLVSELKNCYLLFNSDYNESCMYGSEVEHSKDCVDNTMIDACELCYQGVNLINCYNVKHSVDCEGCRDVWFSKNCVNCSDCVGCINLRNQKYHIFNTPYSKEEYEKKLKEYNLRSHAGITKLKKEAQDFFTRFPHKYIHSSNIANVSGDYIYNSKNVRNAYIATESKDCRYCMWLLVKPNKDCYDYTQFGDNAERVYDSVVCGRGVSDVKFSSFCVDNVSDISYSEFCYNSSNLFGCSYMQRSKHYCILNKQYSKEEYEALVPKIVEHMNVQPYIDSKGRIYTYGEFAPPEMSVFAYNETEAQEFFPKTKEEATRFNFRFKDAEEKGYQITLEHHAIPDDARAASDTITKEVLGCAHNGGCDEQCTKAFRITPQELQFYKRLELPLPHLCPNCRSFERTKLRNPLLLWKRSCECAGRNSENNLYANTASSHPSHEANSHCPNEFETSYAPDRKEIVYCEACYNSEVA